MHFLVKHTKLIASSILLLMLWVFSMSITEQIEQYLLLFLSALGFIVIQLYAHRNVISNQKDKLLFHSLTSTSIVVFLFIIWNIIFSWYSNNTTFNDHIFRGVFNHFRSPFYGSLSISKKIILNSIPAILVSTIFGIFIIIKRKQLHRTHVQTLLILLSGLMILAYGWNTSLAETFLPTNCHFLTFGEDVDKFESLKHLLISYQESMHELSAHNNHYPPGFLMLLLIEKLYLPYFTKIIVFVFTFGALIPLNGLMKMWNFSTSERNLSIIFYTFNGAILFYSGIALTPFLIPLALASLYFLLKSLSVTSLYSLLFAVSFALFSFFSFLSLIFALFIFILLVILMIKRSVESRKLISYTLISISSLVIIYFFIKIFMGFDYIGAFFEGRNTIQNSISNTSNNTLASYLISSFGNLIAYFGILGIPSIGLLSYGLFSKQIQFPKQIKSILIALFITITALSFSNQFILEVERVWIFFTPLFLAAAGWVLAQFYKRKNYTLVYSFIILGIASTVILKIMINFCG